jgi:hypothetical protein
MNIINLTKEKIICNKNGLILCDYAGVNSISFLADLPKSAVVDHIKVDGVYLEDIEAVKVINAHMELTEGEFRVAATVFFFDEIPEIYNKLANYQVDTFDVYYHLEAVVKK